MKTHRPVVWTADAAEQEVVLLVLGCSDILETLGRFADSLDERVGIAPSV